MPENSPKATMQVSSEGSIRPRSSRSDCSTVPPLLTLFKQTTMLMGNLTPSPRQPHRAEGKEKREITTVTGDNYIL